MNHQQKLLNCVGWAALFMGLAVWAEEPPHKMAASSERVLKATQKAMSLDDMQKVGKFLARKQQAFSPQEFVQLCLNILWGGENEYHFLIAEGALMPLEDPSVVPGLLTLWNNLDKEPPESWYVLNKSHKRELVYNSFGSSIVSILKERWLRLNQPDDPLAFLPSDPLAFPAIMTVYQSSRQGRDVMRQALPNRFNEVSEGLGGGFGRLVELPPAELTRMRDAFLPLVTHQEGFVRAGAVEALAGLSLWTDPEVFGRILTTLQDPDVEVRRMALMGLREIRQDRTVQKAVGEAALRDGDAGLRRAAVVWLGECADPTLAEVFRHARQDADPVIAKTAWVELARLGKVSDLQQVAEWLAQLPPATDQTPFLDGDLFRIVWAARDRPELRPLITAEWLQQVLKRPETGFRTQAIQSLFQSPDPITFPALKHWLEGPTVITAEERNLADSVSVSSAITFLQGEGRLAFLRKAMEHPARRTAALGGWQRLLGEPEALVVLLENSDASTDDTSTMVGLTWYMTRFMWVPSTKEGLYQALISPELAPRLWKLKPATRLAFFASADINHDPHIFTDPLLTFPPLKWVEAFQADPCRAETAAASLAWLGPMVATSVLPVLLKHQDPQVRWMALMTWLALPGEDPADHVAQDFTVSPDALVAFGQENVRRMSGEYDRIRWLNWLGQWRIRLPKIQKARRVLSAELDRLIAADPVPAIRRLAAYVKTARP